MVERWVYVAAALGGLGALGVGIALALQPHTPPALGDTVNGANIGVVVNCGVQTSLKSVGGTPNGPARFVASSTGGPGGIVPWTVCPSCFEGQFDGNGNFNTHSVFVTGVDPIVIYVSIEDLSTLTYGNWVAVTVLPAC